MIYGPHMGSIWWAMWGQCGIPIWAPGLCVRGENVGPIWDAHMGWRWGPHGAYTAKKFQVITFCVGHTWVIYGSYMGSRWGMYGIYMGPILDPDGVYMGFTWGQYGIHIWCVVTTLAFSHLHDICLWCMLEAVPHKSKKQNIWLIRSIRTRFKKPSSHLHPWKM